MKTELEKFIETEDYNEFKAHLIFLYQLYLMEENFNKADEGRLSVFPALLQYISIGLTSKNTKIEEFVKSFNTFLDK